MGLTIHYSLQSDARTIEDARERVRQLRKRATTLPFANVSELMEVSADACDFQQRPQDDPRRWLLVQAGRFVEHEGYTFRVPPRRVIAFTAIPGEGCEPANFGLCQYPPTFRAPDGRDLPSNVPALWCWQSLCKTQYASNPGLGGIESFLKCHLSVIRLLDAAAELGLKPEVSDESGYWEHRRVELLVEEVGRWNQAIAAFVGQMKDLLGSGKDVQSEITKFPDYEHREAKGRAGESSTAGDDL
jgi:hypothetical protein